METPARPLLRFDGVEFSPTELQLVRDGKVTALQPKVSRLLELLVARAGQVVTKEELFGQLWPATFVNEEALTQLVRKLRRALGDDAQRPRFVQTVTNRGCRFVLEVVTVMAAPVCAEGPRSAAVAATWDGHPTARQLGEPMVGLGRRWLAAIVLGVATVLGLVTWLVIDGRRQPLLRLGTTAVRRLTHTATHKQDPAFSPDGRLVVFAANDPGEGQLDLFLLSVLGGGVTRLTHTPGDEYFPSFSPDGEWVLCSRFEANEPGSVVLIPGLGGVEKVVVEEATWGCWSPAGNEVAFVRRSDPGWEIVRRSLASGSERRIAKVDAPVVSLTWSPDGRQLAWTDESRLLVVPAQGGQVRQVGEAAKYIRSVRWEQATGALLTDACWRGRNDLWRVDPASGRRQPITAAGGNLFHPAASRDGRRIVFVQESKEYVVLALDEEGRQPKPLATKTTLRQLAVDLGGNWLAFTDDDPAAGAGQVAVMPAGGGAARALCDRPASSPAFSWNGGEIALVRRDTSGEWLAVVSITGGAPRTVSHERGVGLGVPAFSPDGRQLAVAGSLGGRGPGLQLVEISTGASRQLAAGDFGAPAWLPDGQALAVCGRAAGGDGLFLVEVVGGATSFLRVDCSRQSPPLVRSGGSSLLVLAGSRSRPRLIEVTVAGRVTGREIALECPPESGFWGVFEVLARPGGGFLALMERYESDLNLLTPAE